MWRRTALIVAIGLALSARSKLEGQEHDCPDLLISDLNWVRFDVVMGRIVLATNRAKQDQRCARRELPGGTSEVLVVSIDRGLTSLRYALTSDTRTMTVDVVRRDDIEVQCSRQQPDGQWITSVYTQAPGREIQISITSGEESAQEYRAPSLWHLLVGAPELYETHILKALKSLRPDWRPLADADTIRAKLVGTAPWRMTTSVSEVRLLVDQMADKNFQVRQAADHELRSRGHSVLYLLTELDGKQLDAEQRLRIREIRRALTGDTSDTPARITAWLINDKQVWLALMGHDDPQNRLAASEHLARIIEQPVGFDPTATASVRAHQVAALRAQLMRR